MKNELEKKVEKFLEKVKNNLARHGGDVRLVKVEGQDVYVELQGACKGCLMANLTLKEGIETQIKAEIPEIKKVINVNQSAINN